MVSTYSGGGQIVTLVFVDLVNSTAIKAALPGSDITARNHTYSDTILTPPRQRVEADLAALGGRVVKTSGDDHFLVFANTAQAAQWAAVLQVSHAQEPISTPLGALRIRIGMHTGAPVTDPRNQGNDIGHEVDYARRLADGVAGGQILLSEAAAALARDARIAGLALHPCGECALKGIGRVPVFELLYGDRQPQPLSVVSPGRISLWPSSRDGPLAPEAVASAAEQERSPTALLLEALARGRAVGREESKAGVAAHRASAGAGARAALRLEEMTGE